MVWCIIDPDSEVVVFAKRTVKDLKLPPPFVTQIAQSIQSQLAEFRSYEGQDMYCGEKIVPIKVSLSLSLMPSAKCPFLHLVECNIPAIELNVCSLTKLCLFLFYSSIFV